MSVVVPSSALLFQLEVPPSVDPRLRPTMARGSPRAAFRVMKARLLLAIWAALSHRLQPPVTILATQESGLSSTAFQPIQPVGGHGSTVLAGLVLLDIPDARVGHSSAGQLHSFLHHGLPFSPTEPFIFDRRSSVRHGHRLSAPSIQPSWSSGGHPSQFIEFIRQELLPMLTAPLMVSGPRHSAPTTVLDGNAFLIRSRTHSAHSAAVLPCPWVYVPLFLLGRAPG